VVTAVGVGVAVGPGWQLAGGPPEHMLEQQLLSLPQRSPTGEHGFWF
jgi:hypothetical protein